MQSPANPRNHNQSYKDQPSFVISLFHNAQCNDGLLFLQICRKNYAHCDPRYSDLDRKTLQQLAALGWQCDARGVLCAEVMHWQNHEARLPRAVLVEVHDS